MRPEGLPRGAHREGWRGRGGGLLRVGGEEEVRPGSRYERPGEPPPRASVPPPRAFPPWWIGGGGEGGVWGERRAAWLRT